MLKTTNTCEWIRVLLVGIFHEIYALKLNDQNHTFNNSLLNCSTVNGSQTDPDLGQKWVSSHNRGDAIKDHDDEKSG